MWIAIIDLLSAYDSISEDNALIVAIALIQTLAFEKSIICLDELLSDWSYDLNHYQCKNPQKVSIFFHLDKCNSMDSNRIMIWATETEHSVQY